MIVGGQTNGITTYWKTSEYSYGQERCLIRRGPLVDIPAPGEPETDYVEPGLPGATPFANADYLIWWKKSMYDAYPTNRGSPRSPLARGTGGPEVTGPPVPPRGNRRLDEPTYRKQRRPVSRPDLK